MNINRQNARRYLQEFDFAGLFTQVLGWNHSNRTVRVHIDGRGYVLRAFAEKKGVLALTCECSAEEDMPQHSQRRKIERAVSKQVHEHFIVFACSAAGEQVWQWIRRRQGEPEQCHERRMNTGMQSGELLLQSLDELCISLEEEESLSLYAVTGRLTRAFDADKVTKKFYDQFSAEHKGFLDTIEGIAGGEDRSWYASVMLNRLMFLYFIQKKGVLNGETDYLADRLRQMQQTHPGRYYDFYRFFLLRLFHEGLGQNPEERETDLNRELEMLLGRVPYLNGGIFAQHALELRYPGIQVPDAAFEKLFAFFDRYTWHLDDRPLKNDSEINPDVLGHIFEKYINQKQMGAYYTGEDITGYICSNTILPCLLQKVEKQCAIAFRENGPLWQMLQQDPDRYIYDALKKGAELPLPPQVEAGLQRIEARGEWNRAAPETHALPTEIWRETIARRNRLQQLQAALRSGEACSPDDLVTRNLNIRQFVQDAIEQCEGAETLLAFWNALQNMRILDPTCGSGAFLFAALRILEPLYEACLQRMEDFTKDLATPEKERPGASRTEFRLVLQNLLSHPSRRYYILKTIIVRNLYGADIMEEAVEICRLRLFLKLASQAAPSPEKANMGVEPLPDVDFNIRAGNTLVGYATLEDIDRLWAVHGRLGFERDREKLKMLADEYALLLEDFRNTQLGLPARRKTAKADVVRAADRELRPELNKELWRLYREANLLPEKTSLEEFQKTHLPFHWFAEFPEAMAHGGFDVVVGNPPYVKQKDIKEYKVSKYETGKCPDIYALTLERSVKLCRQNGRIGMIVPISLTFSREYSTLRKMLLPYAPTWISSYDIIPASIFNNANQRCTIWLACKSSTGSMHTAPMRRWKSVYRSCLMQTTAYTPCAEGSCQEAGYAKLADSAQSRIYALLQRHAGDWPKLGAAQLGFSTSARNYLTAFLEAPPCLHADTLAPLPSSKIGQIAMPNMHKAFCSLVLASGDLCLWYWLAAGDGFDVTKDVLVSFLAAFQGIAPEAEMLAELGSGMHTRRFECIHLKKNAGLYVSSFNFRRLPAYIRRADLLACSWLGAGREDTLMLLDYMVRVLSINNKTGDKAIPHSAKALFPPLPVDTAAESALFARIDAHLCRQFGFTPAELEFLISHDTRYPDWEMGGE